MRILNELTFKTEMINIQKLKIKLEFSIILYFIKAQTSSIFP